MDHILSSPQCLVDLLVLRGQHKQSEGALLEHFVKNIADRMSCSCAGLERLNVISMQIRQMVLQHAPLKAATMPNEDCWRVRLRRRHGVRNFTRRLHLGLEDMKEFLYS